MQASGQVLAVRPWDFKGNDGATVFMLSIDLYDETVGTVVKIETRESGNRPEKKQEVEAEISGFKKAKFGDGVVFTARKVNVINPGALPSGGENATFPPPPGVQPIGPEQIKPGLKK
jgi:hypothetical protein